MNYFHKFALAGLVFANGSLFAATPVEGWYAGLIGGFSFTPGIKFNATVFDVFTSRTRVNYRVGGNGGGQLGYRICNFRFEGELLFNYVPYSQVKTSLFLTIPNRPTLNLIDVTIKRHLTPTNPFVRLNGHTIVGAGLFNAYYDFYDEENDPTWVPYLGLGIGYSSVRNSLTLTVPNTILNPLVPVPLVPVGTPNVFTVSATKSKSVPIGQIIVGIGYYYSDYLAFGLDYRYVTTQTIKELNTRAQSSTINLNFNYWFDDD